LRDWYAARRYLRDASTYEGLGFSQEAQFYGCASVGTPLGVWRI